MSASVSVRLADRRGSCKLWLESCPRYAGLATACIGELRCDDIDAGRAIVDRALEELAARNFEFAIGPMEGDTWHTYRLVTDSDGSAPFPLEPVNPLWHVDAFRDFDVIARYSSRRVDEQHNRDLTAYGERLQVAGVRVRHFDRRRAERDLLAIYRLSLRAFAANFLYTPIAEGAFMDLYRPLVERVDPRLILLAEDDSLQAFMFAFRHGRTAVIKTYASVRPGLGAYLVERLQTASSPGFDTVVHALMHEHNVSQNHSRKSARTFRRYALYGRRL